MSERSAKKFRKEVQKRVDKNFGLGLEALSNIVRQRPKWIPKWIWVLVYLPLFPKRYLKKIYKELS